MITSQHKEIINRLKEATISGDLNWKGTGLSNYYEVSLGDYKVNIYNIEDNGAFQVLFPDTVCAELSFLDNEGSVFDKITVYTTKGDEYKELNQLYDIARRSATGVDRKLNDLLSKIP